MSEPTGLHLRQLGRLYAEKRSSLWKMDHAMVMSFVSTVLLISARALKTCEFQMGCN